MLTASPYTPFALFDGGTLGSPFGGAGERSETERGAQLRLTRCLPGLTAVRLAPPVGELSAKLTERATARRSVNGEGS